MKVLDFVKKGINFWQLIEPGAIRLGAGMGILSFLLLTAQTVSVSSFSLFTQTAFLLLAALTGLLIWHGELLFAKALEIIVFGSKEVD